MCSQAPSRSTHWTSRAPFLVGRTLFVLTNNPVSDYVRDMPSSARTNSRVDLEHALQVIQVAYPQIYLACHTRHQRERTTEHGLSSRDSSILAHLDITVPMTPSKLASHLGIARSTLSEAIKHLSSLGYTTQETRESDRGNRGGVGVLLTQKGLDAIRETSVLEAPRLRAALTQLTASQLRDVTRGLSALAMACRTATANIAP